MNIKPFFMYIIARFEVETKKIAADLAATLKGGDIVTLQGELGAGKTTFAKGVAEALGIEEEITSPTFTLMNIYNLKTLKHRNTEKLVHIDTYRLKDEQELIQIGVEDYLGDKNTICLIEWPEKIKSLLQRKNVIKVKLQYDEGNIRKIEIQKNQPLG